MRNLTDGDKDKWILWFRSELTEGGDGTIVWFLPEGGAYVFPGDARHGDTIHNASELEKYFCPSFTAANREDIFALAHGDGPLAIEGTREELYALLFAEEDSPAARAKRNVEAAWADLRAFGTDDKYAAIEACEAIEEDAWIAAAAATSVPVVAAAAEVGDAVVVTL